MPPLFTRSWHYLLSATLAAVAGFLWLLVVTAPVRGPADLATLQGTVARVGRDPYGAIVVELREGHRSLLVSRSDLPLLDAAAFEQRVRPGAQISATVLAARWREGDTQLVALALQDSERVYLPLGPSLDARLHETRVILPGIALVLSAAAALAAWAGLRETRRQRQLQLARSAGSSYRVQMRSAQLLAAMIIGFFGFLTVIGWPQLTPLSAVALAAFMLVGLGLLALSATIELDRVGVRVRTPLGRWYIEWDEIQAASYDPNLWQIVLRGRGVQLVVPGPRYWTGAESLAAEAFLTEQLAARAIPLQEQVGAVFARSYGSRW